MENTSGPSRHTAASRRQDASASRSLGVTRRGARADADYPFEEFHYGVKGARYAVASGRPP